MSKTSKASSSAGRQPNLPISVMIWRGDEQVTRIGFTDPLEALLVGITYLRRKYSVRLTNAACDALEDMAPELERLLPSDLTDPGAAARELARRAQGTPNLSLHPGGLAATTVRGRLGVPATRFAAPPAPPGLADDEALA